MGNGSAARAASGHLAAKNLMADACRATGLQDFGADHSFGVGLEVLVDATNSPALPDAVRQDALGRIGGLLQTRLRLIEDDRLHPAIRRQAIVRPMVITGLPRTGTTVTFDLLALDPAARYPRDWEWLAPWPATRAETIDSDPRIAAIQPMIDRFLQRAPELADMYRFDCTAPGECNCGFMHHFSSTNYWGELGLRGHAEWLIADNPRGLYDDHRRLLQQMQWRGPPGRWLLKSPQHLFDLPALFGTYPDARIVWTHRDPVATFSSLASMIAVLHQVVGLVPDRREIGDIVVRTWSRALLSAVEARADPRIDSAIIDLPHRAIVADPVGSMRRVHAFFEQPFADPLADRMAHFVRTDDKAARVGRHRHRPEDHGIDPVAVRRTLQPYYRRFGELI